jgi:CheY-like chemotaxis protein
MHKLDLAGARILIVDDVPANLEILWKGLEATSYQVLVAANGKRALEIANGSRPDPILLDVMMPEMDGFETCRQLKTTAATQDIPVIFLTAQNETSGVLDGFEVGGGDIINGSELLSRPRRTGKKYRPRVGRPGQRRLSGKGRRQGHWHTLSFADGLPSHLVMALHYSPSGHLWVGTWLGGLSRYDGRTFVNFDVKDGLAYDKIYAIWEDNIGRLWLGTNGGGVSVYNGQTQTVRTFSTRDGLAGAGWTPSPPMTRAASGWQPMPGSASTTARPSRPIPKPTDWPVTRYRLL